jgi:hypothetical protein
MISSMNELGKSMIWRRVCLPACWLWLAWFGLACRAVNGNTNIDALPLTAQSLTQTPKQSFPKPFAYKLPERERQAIQRLLDAARSQTALGARMKLVSQELLGRPYLVRPLKGSLTEPEQLVTRVDGFDCVTYVETVLALGSAKTVDDFPEQLRRLRYADGEVAYGARLHYTTEWNKANLRRGFLQDLTQGALTVERFKVLNYLPGVEPHNECFRFFPKARLSAVSKGLQDGDLIYFVSGRKGLDTNHLGLVFRDGERLVLRHATRSRRKVVEQDLAAFCQTHLMLGFIVARPLEQR